MRIPTRWKQLGILTAASVSAAVFALPQAAMAATLTDNRVYHTYSTTRYGISPTKTVWSVAAVYSAGQWNESLFTGSGGWLESSEWTKGKTDFIAIDSGRLGLSSYQVEATRSYGSSAYVQWRQAVNKVVLPYPANDGVSGPSDPDIAFASIRHSDVVSISRVWLNAGEMFWVNTTPGGIFYFLEDNPYDPQSAIQTRKEATYMPWMRQVGWCTLYRADYTGWHALVMVNDATPYHTTPPGGRAVVLHRFDPTRPDTCPQRNFPAPTPPGP